MRHTSPVSKNSNTGFTLVEVLVAAPIALLAIATLVVTIVSMTGSTIRHQAHAQLQYDVLAALDRIEEDAEIAADIKGMSSTLIDFDSFATSSHPFNPDRQLYNRNTCGALDTVVDRDEALLYSIRYQITNGKLVREPKLDHGCESTHVMLWMKTGPATLIDTKGGSLQMVVSRPTSTSLSVTLTAKRTVSGEEIRYTGSTTVKLQNM